MSVEYAFVARMDAVKSPAVSISTVLGAMNSNEVSSTQEQSKPLGVTEDCPQLAVVLASRASVLCSKRILTLSVFFRNDSRLMSMSN